MHRVRPIRGIPALYLVTRSRLGYTFVNDVHIEISDEQESKFRSRNDQRGLPRLEAVSSDGTEMRLGAVPPSEGTGMRRPRTSAARSVEEPRAASAGRLQPILRVSGAGRRPLRAGRVGFCRALPESAAGEGSSRVGPRTTTPLQRMLRRLFYCGAGPGFGSASKPRRAPRGPAGPPVRKAPARKTPVRRTPAHKAGHRFSRDIKGD